MFDPPNSKYFWRIKMTTKVSDPSVIDRKFYFVNECVEWALTKYLWTGCVDVQLRDEIMSNASELIRQIIRKQGLHTIYPGQEESSFGDLLNVAWVQLEKTLYKYRACPHCRRCFKYDRPSESLLYKPQPREYGIVHIDEITNRVRTCPKCRAVLSSEPIVEPKQGTYGGSETILYRGMSKVFNMWCVAPDTMLLSNDGITTIGRFVSDELEYAYGINGFKKVDGYLEKPSCEAVKLTTLWGYNITTSPEHRLMVQNAEGCKWSQVGELQVGDLLGMQFDQQVFLNQDEHGIMLEKKGNWIPPEVITEELGYIIGLFIAEGSYSYNKLVLYNVDEYVIDKLLQNTLGLNFINEPRFQRISLCNVRFIEFLVKLGFGERTSAETKFLPNKLLKTSKLILSSILRGMFDGDGHSRKSDGCVGYTSTSKQLIDQLRMILLNFGIFSKLTVISERTREFTVGVVSNTLVSYQLLLPPEYSKRFYCDIGFGIPRKINTNMLTEDPDDYGRLYGVPNKFANLHRKYGPGKLDYSAIRSTLKGSFCNLKNAKNKLSSWNGFSDDDDYKFIKDRIDERHKTVNKIMWLPIKKIVETESELREISVVSDDHSYIANGFISHNSQVSRTVILAYIKKEARDRKNSGSYISHLSNKSKPLDDVVVRFISEARDICQYNDDYTKVIDSLEWLVQNDERPHDGIIGKLIDHSGLSRIVITSFMKFIKLRSLEFTDSPISRGISEHVAERHEKHDFDNEEE